ncbi:MAG: hypothetical protein ABIJ97_02210, partial [Bacteroidota bacterium]
MHTVIKIMLVVSICGLMFNQAYSQEKSDSIHNVQIDSIIIYPKNSYYVELLGNGILYSLNYERMIYQKNKMKLSARIGIESCEFLRFSIPVEFNCNIGKRKKNLEFGLGYNPFNDDLFAIDEARSLLKTSFFTLRIGYRYQGSKGFLFRSGLLFMTPSYYLIYYEYYW